MPTKIYLIRHGETDWNVQKRYCSYTNIALNKKGINQIKSLNRLINFDKVERVYSSNMIRAIQSAQMLFKNHDPIQIAELSEFNFGIWEGLTYQEIMDQYSDLYGKWIENPVDISIPIGDNLKNYADRVEKIFNDLTSKNKNRNIAIVTHAGFIKVLLFTIMKSSLTDIWKLNINIASVSELHLINNEWNIILFNKTGY